MMGQAVCYRCHDQATRLHQFKEERRHDLDAPAKCVSIPAQSHRRCPPWLAVNCIWGLEPAAEAEYKSVGTLCGAQAGSIELVRRCYELKGHADADADSS